MPPLQNPIHVGCGYRAVQNVSVNRGQNMARSAIPKLTRPRLPQGRYYTIEQRPNRPSTGRLGLNTFPVRPYPLPLAPPWEQVGREIRGGLAFAVRRGGGRPGIWVRDDHLSIEVPGGVAQERGDDGEAKEKRQRAYPPEGPAAQSPRCPRPPVLGD